MHYKNKEAFFITLATITTGMAAFFSFILQHIIINHFFFFSYFIVLVINNCLALLRAMKVSHPLVRGSGWISKHLRRTRELSHQTTAKHAIVAAASTLSE